jgi:two-component system chemotaxis response regulator CheY
MDSDVLVVDDSAAIRKILQRVLRQTGMAIGAIHEAGDGQEALCVLGEHPVNLVLTDINMPKMDGFGLIEAVRKDSRHSKVPILVLTTESDAAKKMRAKEAGATGWIVKPFEPVKLIAAIRRVAA